MLIENKELKIRNAEETDAEILTKWWNDGRVMAHAGFPNGLGTTAGEVAAKIRTDSDNAGRRLIIELDGTPIGEMSYRRTDGNSAEIGIKICDFSKQEKGYGKRLLSMLIKELFKMGFDMIKLDTNLNNKRAQHVYEELGFKKIRINTDAWTDQLGVPQSAVDYELKKGELVDFT